MREVTSEVIRAMRTADWIAVDDDDGRWPMSVLVGEAEHLAAELRELGVRPTVLVQSENSRRTVVAALAVGMVDGTLALAGAHFSAADVRSACDSIRPDVIVGDADRLAAWQLAGPATGRTVADGWLVRPWGGIGETADRWGGGVLIGMTSGSTGRSKGVIHSEAALRYAVEQQIAAAELARHDPVGIIVPLSAAPAFTFGVYLSLVLRAPAVMSRGWDPAAAVNQLASTGARWTMCVPTQVLQLAAAAGETDRPLRRMRAITVGGGPMRLEAMLDAEARLGVTLLRVFGLSECLGHTTPRLGEPAELRLSRDGRPFPGTTVRILDEEGRPVPAGTPGRAQVRGPSLFLGYAEAGRLQSAELTPDGFLDTGDLIVSYPDGMLKVSGRIKDVVIRGGRNLSVAEIEEALADDPRIEQACAVPVPDSVLGERVAALVVPRAGGLTLKEILAGMQDRGVAKATWPEYVVLAERLPMTAVGKVSRAEARATVLRELGLEEES